MEVWETSLAVKKFVWLRQLYTSETWIDFHQWLKFNSTYRRQKQQHAVT
jgi:hypothetical protein